jgi:CheY-like chemotaxis protein
MGMKFTDKLNTVLVIDDEPFQTEWLTEYFRARGYKVVEAEDLQSALDALEGVRYRYVIIDLSIPFSPALAQPLAALGTEFFRYPGLMAARKARTTGHNTFQVVVYSVHDSSEVESYAERIECHYILKGRPRELKNHIEDTMRRKPHGWRLPRPKAEPRKRPARAAPIKNKRRPAKKGLSTIKKKSFYARYPTFVTMRKKKSPATSQ